MLSRMNTRRGSISAIASSASIVRPGGEAAHELAVGDGVAGVAREFLPLDGQRELEPPLEHHLEDDVKVGAVGLYAVDKELARFGLSDAGLVEPEDTEADVGNISNVFT